MNIIKKRLLLCKTCNNPLEAVEIETTSICNRKCKYCPTSITPRPQKYMEEKIFHKIIDSLVEIDFHGRISPHFYGEPLMDKRLSSLLRYTKEKLPRAHIKLFTNGDLLTVEKYKELCGAGVEIFRVSQHSAEPSKVITETLAYVNEHIGQQSIKPIEYVNYYNEYYTKNNTTSSKLLNNRGGLIQKINTNPSKYCIYVNQLTFDYEGNAVLCCNDYFSSVKFGNIATSSVKEIWNDVNYVKARRTTMSGKWIYDICEKCNTNYGLNQLNTQKAEEVVYSSGKSTNT